MELNSEQESSEADEDDETDEDDEADEDDEPDDDTGIRVDDCDNNFDIESEDPFAGARGPVKFPTIPASGPFAPGPSTAGPASAGPSTAGPSSAGPSSSNISRRLFSRVNTHEQAAGQYGSNKMTAREKVSVVSLFLPICLSLFLSC